MADFLVTYDLVDRPQIEDYQPLWNALEQLGAKKVLLSVYWLRSTMNVEQLRDHLMFFIDMNDRLLVVRFEAASWKNLMHAIVRV